MLPLLQLLLSAFTTATAAAAGAAAGAVAASQAPRPTALMMDYQSGLALGVSARPLLSWVVPACGTSNASRQTAYRIVVAREGAAQGQLRYSTSWDSGKVSSNASANVLCRGLELEPGAVYRWNVTTWTASAAAAESGGTRTCSRYFSPTTVPGKHHTPTCLVKLLGALAHGNFFSRSRSQTLILPQLHHPPTHTHTHTHTYSSGDRYCKVRGRLGCWR